MNKHFEEYEIVSNASEYLSDSLFDGSLILFLGAGASMGFGLPDWVTLVNELSLSAGIAVLPHDASAEELQQAADEIAEKFGNTEKLLDEIETILYRKINTISVSNALDNKLLISVASLLMGSKRGHVSRVVTLNYDSMLEWFLSIFGFSVNTIYKLPCLEGSEDVRIYHPHGYIPNPNLKFNRSNFVILGRDAVHQRLGTPGEPWFEMVRHILETGVCLFIGMSGKSLSDAALSPLFLTSGKKIEGQRPLGIWLLFEDITDAKRNEFRRKNIVPLVTKTVDDISEFLFQICQKAMIKINRN